MSESNIYTLVVLEAIDCGYEEVSADSVQKLIVKAGPHENSYICTTGPATAGM